MRTQSLLVAAVAGLLSTGAGPSTSLGASPSTPLGAGAQQAPEGPQKPATTGPSTSLGAGNPQAGKQLYLDYSCWACHGYNAQTGNGQRLLPPRFTEQQFTRYLRTPRTRQMPAYTAKVLSDADAAHLYAYILSLPREPQLKDVPLLNLLPK